jgi:hypothetical protein
LLVLVAIAACQPKSAAPVVVPVPIAPEPRTPGFQALNPVDEYVRAVTADKAQRLRLAIAAGAGAEDFSNQGFQSCVFPSDCLAGTQTCVPGSKPSSQAEPGYCVPTGPRTQSCPVNCDGIECGSGHHCDIQNNGTWCIPICVKDECGFGDRTCGPLQNQSNAQTRPQQGSGTNGPCSPNMSCPTGSYCSYFYVGTSGNFGTCIEDGTGRGCDTSAPCPEGQYCDMSSGGPAGTCKGGTNNPNLGLTPFPTATP